MKPRFRVSIEQCPSRGNSVWAYSVNLGTKISNEKLVAIGYGVSIVDAAKVAEKQYRKFAKAALKEFKIT